MKKILTMLTMIVVLTIGALFVYGYTLMNGAENMMASTFDDLGLGSEEGVQFDNSKPFTILLMGIDTGGAGRENPWEGRSDSMIVATVNPKTNTTTMTSLERDMLVDLLDKNGKATGKLTKLNDAYSEGGPKMSIVNIQDIIGFKIDAYAFINMQGLVTLVDAIGGITVNNTLGDTISIEDTEPDYKATVKPGIQHLNGDQALVYSRMRYQDPEGDIGRQARQREVITKVIEKLLTMNSVSNYRNIFESLSGNLKTNIKINSNTLMQLMGFSSSFETIQSIKLQGVGEMINEVSYQVMPENNLLSVQNTLRRSIGKDTLDSLSPDIVTFEKYFGSSPNTYEIPSIAISKNNNLNTYFLQTDGEPNKEMPVLDTNDSSNGGSTTPSTSREESSH
ncbi:LCP family protein [Floricoccus penangensis]|uniref:LCP family protein n=1 Tax=Floricoccus penangensis TaxID=1859475 RepID=UPI00203C0476|nr:LCP family protein [Floricoccus penangensis]URZ87235.1 LCP family protein [Floricoccus penangensis]